MGYELHITRATDWFENDSSRIPLADWVAYVESDPEMRLDNYAEAKTPHGVLRVEEPGIAVWLAYSRNGENGNYAWFTLSGGNVVVKNPDAEIIAKMCQVASALDARVQGDDGEYYPEAIGAYTGARPTKKPASWWKRLLHLQ